MTALHAELRSAAHAVTHANLRQLVALGVGWPTIGELGRHHDGFGVVTARDAGDGLYEPDPDGQPHLLLPVYEDGELVDLVAFRSDAPDKWMLRTGNGWALGLDEGWGMLHNGDPLRLSATPLDWLRNEATGLCVLDWEAPELTVELADFAAVQCPDATIAGLLTEALTQPSRLPSISVGETRLVA